MCYWQCQYCQLAWWANRRFEYLSGACHVVCSQGEILRILDAVHTALHNFNMRSLWLPKSQRIACDGCISSQKNTVIPRLQAPTVCYVVQ